MVGGGGGARGHIRPSSHGASFAPPGSVPKTCLRLIAAAALLAIAVPDASAQYFGRNKVQYRKLDFQVLKTDHFDIYFYPEEREGIDIAARLSERWLARLEKIFAHQLRGRQPLVLYASHPDFEQTNAIPGELGEGTGGVTEPIRRRIVLPFGGPLADTDHVIGHELVHAFQFDITTRPDAPPGQTGAERLPLWFIEGMAEYLSLGPVDPNTAMWLRDAVRGSEDSKRAKEKLPAIEDLDNPKYFPYRWGQAFWAYVGGRYGDNVIRRMLAIGAAAGDYNVAIERVLGIKTKQLSEEWHAAIRQAYAPVLASTTAPSEVGRLVIGSSGFGGDLNVGPALSPDGRYVAFLSTRSIFSTDLFVADTANGSIIKKLTSTATDAHLNSIEFIYSAGGWDAASQRIAIATVVAGRAALAIYGMPGGDKQREVPIDGVDEIFNPTWSPDGNALCFTGLRRGLTDLYVYDLGASKLRQLTNDAYADLQPAWSPDGRRIAFATDRFSSDLTTLNIGPYRLATIDLPSGRVDQVRAFTSGKNINPQWTPDGSALLFISDRDGIPNLYRVSLDGGDVAQLTRIATGLSGITSSSPALSVSSKTGVAAFSVYEDGKYAIYMLDGRAGGSGGSGGSGRSGGSGGSSGSGGSGTTLTDLAPLAAMLPPIDRQPSDVASLLESPSFGLPEQKTYEAETYKPKLSLEGLAQPSIGVGASRYGAALGGGVAFQFGDLLGDHTLITAVQFQSLGGSFSAKDTAAQALYYNAKNRWNWGIVAGQNPYLSGGFQSGLAQVGNELARVDQTIIFRQTEQSAGGIVAYPFNRAERIEFQGGITRLTFDEIVQTQAVGLQSGQLLINDSQTTSLQSPLTLGNTSVAFVHDTSNFGATSPVAGSRYRFEVAPAIGSITYTGLLADYRRYFMPAASFYTIATRVMHYGRYGSGGEDSRLFPLYLGYPSLVHGYDVNTFDSSDCVATATSACPVFDRLLGSRVLVGNLEFRFPLLRPFGASNRMYGPVPVEVAFFADGGVAWNNLKQATAATLLAPEQQPHAFDIHDGVASAGAALRVNLFGFAVGEFSFAHPFQRPAQSWVFQFNLTPGW
jgi:Tol biopolymer transport system component